MQRGCFLSFNLHVVYTRARVFVFCYFLSSFEQGVFWLRCVRHAERGMFSVAWGIVVYVHSRWRIAHLASMFANISVRIKMIALEPIAVLDQRLNLCEMER